MDPAAARREIVELSIVETVSDNTIGRTFKKRAQTAPQTAMGDRAGGQRGFVAAMEDVLETYQKPRNPDRPLVRLDETSKQLIVETRIPIPVKPGNPRATTTNTNATAWPICS